MKDFLAHHSYLIIWILALIIVGSIAILIVQLNGITTGPLNPETATPVTIPPIPTIPPKPSVTLTIVKSAGGNSLFVQWQNLPDNTMALDIFRGKTGATSTWMLWKTLTLTPGELANGTANLDLGTSLESGYSFYVQAVTGGGDSSSTIIWTSSSTVPVVATSTPGGGPAPSGNNPPPDNTPSSSPSSSSPSSPENPSSTSPGAPSSSNPGTPGNGNNSSTPPGNPYYNPEVKITGYGTAPGSFWVEHLNQSIQIGWQNIPAGVDTIMVARGASSTGPWTTIITQQNPGSNGSYSLQLVDDNLDQSNYYEMTALEATTTIATYGPVYLEASN
jgi:hypothetical protein